MASANVTNTSVVPAVTKVHPYWDDFQDNKNFHRILAKPGFPVQAREFTQAQTIGQVQLERLGRHLFTDGSIVQGGQISFDTAATINLQSQYAGSDIDATVFIGQTVTANGSNSVIAQVVSAVNATQTDPPIIQVKYLSGASFSNNDVPSPATSLL